MTDADRSGLPATGWAVSHRSGAGRELFADGVPESAFGRSVEVLSVERPTVVLGSAQHEQLADRDALARHGAVLVHRRTGGGAVWLDRDGMLWVDVLLPVGDPLWEPDVARAFHWLGDVWTDALRRCGVEGASVHRGALVRNEWSDLLCFAGIGAGEVLLDGRKCVGISQRRTRHGARFQCGVLLAWDPVPLVEVLVRDGAQRPRGIAALRDACAPVGVRGDRLLEAFVASLPPYVVR